MGQHRSPYSTLKHLDAELIRRFLSTHGEFRIPKDWAKLTPAKRADHARKFIVACDEPVRSRIEADLAVLGLFDHGDGTAWLIAAAQHFKQIEIERRLPALLGHFNRALMVSLEHEDAFSLAAAIAHAEAVRGSRSWFERGKVPCGVALDIQRVKEPIGQSLSAYYQEKQDRGRFHHVDIHQVGAERVYFFIQLSNHSESQEEFNERGGFSTPVRTRPFEALFVYDSKNGVLATHAAGGMNVINELQAIFGTVVLGCELEPVKKSDGIYTLDPILTRGFEFATEINDGIERVELKSLRCRVRNSKRRLTFEGDSERGPLDTLRMIDEYLNRERIRREHLFPLSAEVTIHFTKPYYRDRKSLVVRIGYRNFSTVNDAPDSLVALLATLFKRWKLHVE